MLRRQSFDVAHLHNIYHHLSPSILPVLARHRVAMVMTAHDYRLACPTKHFLRPDGPCTRCLPNRYYHAVSPRCAGLRGGALALESFIQRFTRRYFRWIDLLLCPTRFMQKILRQAGAPAGKTIVLRNIIEPVTLSNSAPQSQPPELLVAGRLSAEKTPILAVELAGLLPDVRIVIAGDGPLLPELRREVQRRGLTNVELTGHIDHDRLGDYLARCTAAVLTSLWFENSPQTMLEAMFAGRCVVVPDHPPLREWVRNGHTGRLYAPGKADALAEVVREVVSDPAGRTRMQQAARQLVRDRHNPEILCRQLEGLYEEAIRRCALR